MSDEELFDDLFDESPFLISESEGNFRVYDTDKNEFIFRRSIPPDLILNTADNSFYHLNNDVYFILRDGSIYCKKNSKLELVVNFNSFLVFHRKIKNFVFVIAENGNCAFISKTMQTRKFPSPVHCPLFFENSSVLMYSTFSAVILLEVNSTISFNDDLGSSLRTAPIRNITKLRLLENDEIELYTVNGHCYIRDLHSLCQLQKADFEANCIENALSQLSSIVAEYSTYEKQLRYLEGDLKQMSLAGSVSTKHSEAIKIVSKLVFNIELARNILQLQITNHSNIELFSSAWKFNCIFVQGNKRCHSQSFKLQSNLMSGDCFHKCLTIPDDIHVFTVHCCASLLHEKLKTHKKMASSKSQHKVFHLCKQSFDTFDFIHKYPMPLGKQQFGLSGAILLKAVNVFNSDFLVSVLKLNKSITDGGVLKALDQQESVVMNIKLQINESTISIFYETSSILHYWQLIYSIASRLKNMTMTTEIRVHLNNVLQEILKEDSFHRPSIQFLV